MSDKTKIEWADATWNPVLGCDKVSPGCSSCYIERTPPYRMAKPKLEFVKGRIPVELKPERLGIPLGWRKPRRIFVNSLSDTFHEDVPDAFLDRMFATMAISGAERQSCRAGSRCEHDEEPGCWMGGEGKEHGKHTFLLLTKRPERMWEYLTDGDRFQRIIGVGNDPEWKFNWAEPEDMILGAGWPLPNVWLGVTAENQHWADERLPWLLRTPAARRFVSCEPLLGSVDLLRWLDREGSSPQCETCRRTKAPLGRSVPLEMYGSMCDRGCPGYSDGPKPDQLWPGESAREFGYTNEPRLDWVIAGGESAGPEHRRLVRRCSCVTYKSTENCGQCSATGWEPIPSRAEWLRSLRDQCQAAGVAYHFKQWGGPTPKSGGRLLDGRTWDGGPTQ